MMHPYNKILYSHNNIGYNFAVKAWQCEQKAADLVQVEH